MYTKKHLEIVENAIIDITMGVQVVKVKTPSGVETEYNAANLKDLHTLRKTILLDIRTQNNKVKRGSRKTVIWVDR